ncbi:HDIG domain-containing protein [Caloranaerobacter azorensis DSM 13643]|uniref:HDIG domain-containing protein n=1 Tax=Caloranaerobacter azorensis DSM 13643 TaxID=1121264 RepID=A0A1M5SFB1_9FIRM|nr:HDIG domain-containing metalloprotein [Caloranaerobacter azorensis]SHH37287.1 HDIG domain-containing protein [Caloranaerobacter azorensis DSM 13643]
MNRIEALKHVKANIKNKNLIKHMLATEAVMIGLARKFKQDEEKWGLAGLLHDIDYEQTANNPEKHSLVGAKMLEELGYDKDIIYAVKVHNDIHGLERISLMDKALYSSDPLTGLIVAAALILPEKKLSKIDTKFILNRFKEKSFAKGANREQIAACKELGLELEEFIEIGLSSMQQISEELGL